MASALVNMHGSNVADGVATITNISDYIHLRDINGQAWNVERVDGFKVGDRVTFDECGSFDKLTMRHVEAAKSFSVDHLKSASRIEGLIGTVTELNIGGAKDRIHVEAGGQVWVWSFNLEDVAHISVGQRYLISKFSSNRLTITLLDDTVVRAAPKLTAFSRSTRTLAPAIELIKRMPVAKVDPGTFAGLLVQMAADKKMGLGPMRLAALNSVFGNAMLLLTRAEQPDVAILDYLGKSTAATASATRAPAYVGSVEQNSAIDRAVYARGVKTVVTGSGLADTFSASALVGLPAAVKNTPIHIIGAGIAGSMARYALTSVGFTKITQSDKAGKSGGIWNQDNVVKGSRNNPRALKFLNASLAVAPGDGSSVKGFSDAITIGAPTKQDVAKVVPGPFATRLTYGDGTDASYPIVINAIGIGKPTPVSDPNRMTTNHPGGTRWQQILTKEGVRGKRLMFVGLGNSTAEMIRQMHAFMDAGVDCDYRVLTHYPEEAVQDPNAVVVKGNKQFRVFRDPTVNLVDYQGDLAVNREDYFRALAAGRIFSNVQSWTTKGKRGMQDVLIKGRGSRALRRGSSVTLGEVDGIYALTGYRHGVTTLNALGVECRSDGSAKYDYDGELFSGFGRTRTLHKGYFGFGAVLNAPWNPNAIVIPGMLARIGDLVFSVIMRAYEYQEGLGAI